jgi:hypothetical protein
MITAMMSLTPENEVCEKKAILAAVHGNPNIESYIFEHFTSEIEAFYLCEMQFWE